MSEPEKKIEEDPGAVERFDSAVANALKMPPKPHVKKGGGKANARRHSPPLLVGNKEDDQRKREAE